MDSFDNHEVVDATICGHVFHRKCIFHWFEVASNTCPHCRKEITPNDLCIVNWFSIPRENSSSVDCDSEKYYEKYMEALADNERLKKEVQKLSILLGSAIKYAENVMQEYTKIMAKAMTKFNEENNAMMERAIDYKQGIQHYSLMINSSEIMCAILKQEIKRYRQLNSYYVYRLYLFLRTLHVLIQKSVGPFIICAVIAITIHNCLT